MANPYHHALSSVQKWGGNVAKSNMSLNDFYQWVIAVYQQLQKQKGEQQTNGASISSRAV